MLKRLFIPLLLFVILLNCGVQTGESVRIRQKFNAGWKFINSDVVDAHLAEFVDSEWRDLNLPHDWAIEGPLSEDHWYQGGFLPYARTGWYRKTFPAAEAGKRFLLEFDGVMMFPRVWVNGQFVGEWTFGYTSFAFDITQYLHHDKENVISVRVENIEYSSRWYPGAGIYRNVWLTVTDPVHIAHWGTYVTTPEISDEMAKVAVETWVENDGESTHITLDVEIVDNKGRRVAGDAMGGTVTQDGRKRFKTFVDIQNPRRWDIEDPYLYTAVCRIQRDGRTVDETRTPFGIRTIRFDADKGFFLNGRSVKIKGVNMHHDLGPLGSAVNTRAMERQLEIMKAMGVNAIRTAHNPPAPEQLDLCDRMGILVMDESFDEWGAPKWIRNGYSILFDEWAERDMRALVLRDRNHPSVILWSTGNEVPDLGTEAGKRAGRMLRDICHELDPTRPVSSGIHLSIPLDREVMDCFDVAGFNYWHEQLEDIHRNYPDKPLLVTEAAATLSSRGEYVFPVEMIYRGWQHESMQITSYDLTNTGFGTLPDVEFKLQDDFEWLAGQFVWSGFDYHGEPDPYEDAWPAHSSYFGIVDMCGFPKDRFYLYQSVWTEAPMIHILPHWNWEGREGEVTPVYCYTNCASAELIVNGQSMGRKGKADGEYRIKWEEVIYEPGSIKAVGYDEEGRVQSEKTIVTAGEPYQVRLVPDRDQIRADGEDLAFVTVRVLDKDGNLCPRADNPVEFELEGGTIAGVGNGNPASTESYQENKRKAFNGLCLVIVRPSDRKMPVSLTASSPGLISETIVIAQKKISY